MGYEIFLLLLVTTHYRQKEWVLELWELCHIFFLLNNFVDEVAFEIIKQLDDIFLTYLNFIFDNQISWQIVLLQYC